MEKSILVFGGCGALGRAVIATFKDQGFRTVSVDFRVSEDAARSLVLQSNEAWGTQLEGLEKELREKPEPNLAVVYCAAGGWAGGNILSDELCANIDKMVSFNLYSAVQASRVAARFMAENGLLVLTGAAAALQGTGTMIAYGVTKAATHHLADSLVGHFKKKGSTVASLLPVTIDTPSNRSGMPDADTSTWTPPKFIAETVLGWATGERPESGSKFVVKTEKNESRLEKV